MIDLNTGKWSTGISVIDNDMALSVLDEEAEKEYTSLYSFDNDGTYVVVDEETPGLLQHPGGIAFQ